MKNKTVRKEKDKVTAGTHRKQFKKWQQQAIPLSAITLNVNGLNSLVERQKVAEQKKQQYPTICCLGDAFEI